MQAIFTIFQALIRLIILCTLVLIVKINFGFLFLVSRWGSICSNKVVCLRSVQKSMLTSWFYIVLKSQYIILGRSLFFSYFGGDTASDTLGYSRFTPGSAWESICDAGITLAKFEENTLPALLSIGLSLKVSFCFLSMDVIPQGSLCHKITSQKTLCNFVRPMSGSIHTFQTGLPLSWKLLSTCYMSVGLHPTQNCICKGNGEEGRLSGFYTNSGLVYSEHILYTCMHIYMYNTYTYVCIYNIL